MKQTQYRVKWWLLLWR